MPTIDLGRIKPIYKGDYSSGTAYEPLDFVSYSGNTYFCILATTGNAPTNTTYWQKLADATSAEGVSYDNTISGLSATNVKSAIDETAARRLKTAICTYEQASGANGGTATTGSWIDLPISTESADPDNIVSLSGDNIVLGAGKYVVEWDSIFHSTNASQTRLKVYNGSTSTYVYGSVVECKSTSYVSAASTGKTYFELTSGGYITLQYRVTTAVSTYGLGVGASFGNVNVFRTVKITKLP